MRILTIILLLCIFGRAEALARVYVILWFDTEDYMLPASDDAAKRLAELLESKKVKATFKVVGEKARVLEKRGRRDVIDALNRHDIGYHANFHSVHPTPTEYLAESGWLDGMLEFARREGAGAADVRRIFHRQTLACYGQPGSSWAPQAIAALAQMGINSQGVPCYVDEGTHVGLNEQPFWYAGALVVYHMGKNYTRMDLHDPSAVEPAKKKVSEIAQRLEREGGGLISIFYHPCEWVHQEFWDGVNFRRGANPPREQWKAPPQRPAEETEGAFRRFSEYIDHIAAIPGIKFVTASELPSLYPDEARGVISEEEVTELSRRIAVKEALNFQVIGRKAFSPADQFIVLGKWLLRHWNVDHSNSSTGILKGMWGPDGPPPPSHSATSSAAQFKTTVADAIHQAEVSGGIPARVFLGAEAVAPADFLRAMAQIIQKGALDKSDVTIPSGTTLLTEQYIAKDTPNLFGGWIIHREGFRAPKVMEIARWQSWSLKPALLQSESRN